MAKWADPRDLRLVIIILRSFKEWNQADLCRETGIDPATMSRYEAGTQTPSRRNLGRIAAAAGVVWAFVEELIPLCRGIRLAYERTVSRRDFEAGPLAAKEELERKLTGAALRSTALFLLELSDVQVPSPRVGDRDWAAVQSKRLKQLPIPKQQLIIDTLDSERIWALAERLGLASVEAAAHRTDQALELAELALRAAGRIPEGSWRSLNEGLAWAVFANARRVGGSLPAAREAFRTSDRLWEAGEGGDPAGLLDGSRRLDLKASLLMNDDQFDLALEALGQAAELSRTEAARARLLVQQSTLFVLMGEAKRAMAVLERAAPLINEAREPRLAFAQCFNLGISLCDLERYSDAEELLPRVREIAVALGRELDLIRTLWLGAKISAGLGRLEAAREAFEQVRRDFEEQKIAYDYAKASLELAVLHLEQGHTAEVATLAEEMWWIFKGQEVHKEALAALRLFCEAARKEQADAAWVRRMIAYLNRAQHNPKLRFER